MSQATPPLDDPTQAGVFFVGAHDLDVLAMYAFEAELLPRRIDLMGVHEKRALLLRIAVALDFPISAGRNWDGLLDGLRDLSWLPPGGRGYVLLLEGAGEMHARNEPEFDTLIAVLDEAQAHWRAQGVPFWAFLALRDKDIAELED